MILIETQRIRERSSVRNAFLRAKKLDPSDPRVKVNLDELDSLEAGHPKRFP